MSPETTPEPLPKPALDRRVLAGTGLQLGARVATALGSLTAGVTIGRAIGPERYGAWVFWFSLYLIAATLVDFGSTPIAVRDCSREPHRAPQILRALFRLRLVASALAVVALAGVALWREGSVRAALLPSLAAMHLLALAPATAGTVLLVQVRLGWVALASVIGVGLQLLLVLALARLGVQEFGVYLLAFAIGTTVQSLVPWLAARRHGSLLGPVEPGLPTKLLREMAPLGFSSAISTGYFRLDALLLATLIGEEAAGRYQQTFLLLSFSVTLPSFLCAALMPAYSRAALRSPDDLLRLVRRTAAALASVAFPAAAMAPFVGGRLLELLWGAARLSDETRRCVPWLGVAGAAIFLTYPQMHALTALGRQRVLAWITLGTALAKLALGWALIRARGMEGAALATAITETGVLVWVSFELRKASGGTAFSSQLLRPAGAAAIAAFAGTWLGVLTPLLATSLTVALLVVAVPIGGALPLRLEPER